jgi:hypothetical protein
MTSPSAPGNDDLEARLERLGRATAGVEPRAGFVDRVVAAAARAPSGRDDRIVRTWWSVPVAAAIAAAAVAWALVSRPDPDHARAARDVDLALSFPGGGFAP